MHVVFFFQAEDGIRDWSVTGVQTCALPINGISEGAAFGDDAQMDSNYPLVRLTDGSGNVYYARTFNWSSTGVMTGNRLVSTRFTVPLNVPSGPLSLIVVANGISSNPVSFSGPVWVDFNYAGFFQFGNFAFPYKTLAQGVSAAPPRGMIKIRTAGSTTETMTISNAMTLVAVRGSATIGRQ